MNYRNQSILFWAKALGYLQNFDPKDMGENQSVEEVLLKGISQDQLEKIRFLYVEQCFLQWLVQEEKLGQPQSQEYLNKKLTQCKEGGKSLVWTCLEYNLASIHSLKKQTGLFLEQKLFSHEDLSLIQKIFVGFQQRPTIEEMHVAHAPSMFGGYQILEEIGRGGMGRVYKAFHPNLKKTVAIKVMLKSQSNKNRKRFLSEAQMMAKLNHPNIVLVHDVGTHEDQDYIVMDYIEGESLADVLKNNKFSTRKSLEMMKEIACGMAYAHSHDIIHRDLKPSNIIMEKKTNRPIIMDFGLAKNLKSNDDLTKSGEILGTPKYMSPEQVEGKSAKISYATDVYSLGAILYEMLTKQEVFSGAETHQIIFKIMYAEIVPPCTHNPLLSKEVEAICLKALEKKQEKRYQNAQEFAEDIERFLNGEAIVARPLRWNQKAFRQLCKHKVSLSIFLFVLLCVAAMGIFFSKTKVSWEKDLARNVSLWWEKLEKETKEDISFLQEHQQIMEKGKSLVDDTILAYKSWKKIEEEQIRERQIRLKNRPSIIEDWNQKQKGEDTKKIDKEKYFYLWISIRRSLFEEWKKLQKRRNLVEKYKEMQEQYENLAKDFLGKKEIYQNIEEEMLRKILQNKQMETLLGKNAIQKEKPAQSFSLALVKYVQKILGTTLDSFSSQEDEQIRQSWLASCILILHKDSKNAKEIQNAVINITGTQYQSILEKIMNQKDINRKDFIDLQDKLERICLKNFSFAPAYYQIARIYHQNDEKEMAQIYYEMALEISEGLQEYDNQRGTLDFFSRYYLSKIYYELWHSFLREQSTQDKEDIIQKFSLKEKETAKKFLENQAKLQEIKMDQEQRSYLKMNKLYDILMKEEKAVLEKYKKLTTKGYLNFYLYPPEEYQKEVGPEQYQKDCQKSIEIYWHILGILAGIQGEIFSSEVAGFKAQIYQDLILIGQEKPDRFEEVLKNFRQAVVGQKWNYSAWKDLANANLILGDYTNTKDFYRQGMAIHPKASWYYMLHLMNEKDRSWETMQELEYHLQFYAHPEEEKEDTNLFLMKKSLLGFLYLKENRMDKLQQIFPYLQIADLDFKQAPSLSEMGKACLANCLYIIICSKLDEKEKAKKALDVLWRMVTQDTSDWSRLRDIMLIKTFLNSLKNYHDPFACEPSFRKINQMVEHFLTPIIENKKIGISYQMVDHSNFLLQIYGFLQQEPALNEKIEGLARSSIKNAYALHLMICILSKIWIDLAEERMIRMEYSSSPQIHYRRTIAHYRRYLHTNNKKKAKSHLQKGLENLEIALEANPSLALYHYVKAVFLAHSNDISDPKIKEDVLFHLSLSLQLGWDKPEFLDKEPAFNKDKIKLKEEIDLKNLVPLQKEPFPHIKQRADLLEKKGKGKQAIQLLQCYEKKIQEERSSKESLFVENMEKELLEQEKENLKNPREIIRKISSFPPEKHKQFLNKLVLLYQEAAKKCESEKQIKQAQEYFQKAIEIHPESWVAYLELAFFYEKQGNQEEFQENWHKAISLTPYTAIDWKEYCIGNF